MFGNPSWKQATLINVSSSHELTSPYRIKPKTRLIVPSIECKLIIIVAEHSPRPSPCWRFKVRTRKFARFPISVRLFWHMVGGSWGAYMDQFSYCYFWVDTVNIKKTHFGVKFHSFIFCCICLFFRRGEREILRNWLNPKWPEQTIAVIVYKNCTGHGGRPFCQLVISSTK